MRQVLNPEVEALLSAMPSLLVSEAERLVAGRLNPLDLMALLRDFGMSLSVSADGADRYHAGALREHASYWEVVIIRPPSELYRQDLTPRERFTIAHELGHYLIHMRFSFKPTSRREYWRLEEICNEFAATLLAPQRAVDAALRTDPQKAADVLSSIQELRRSTRISFEAASRRLVAAMERPAAVAGLKIERNRAKQEGRLRWMYEKKFWMGHARNRSIASTHPFARAILCSKPLLTGQVLSIELPDTVSACVLRASDEDVFLVAMQPPKT